MLIKFIWPLSLLIFKFVNSTNHNEPGKHKGGFVHTACPVWRLLLCNTENLAHKDLDFTFMSLHKFLCS